MTNTPATLQCPSCHYRLDNLTSDTCPECGQRFEIVRPLMTTVGPAPRDWRYWASMAAWAIGIMLYMLAWITQSIFWFNVGTGFMISLIALVIIGKR